MGLMTDCVVGGKYKGSSINLMGGRPYVSGAYIDFSSENVKSLKKVTAEKIESIGRSDQKFLVEVEWADGGKSLLRLEPRTYEKIIAAQYEESKVDSETLKEMETENSKSGCLFFVIAMIFLTIFFWTVI